MLIINFHGRKDILPHAGTVPDEQSVGPLSGLNL